MIQSHAMWELADIYADEGITGTSAKKRDDFQRMLADCRKGRIDKILVKSISRFARNTTDCLEALRELKALGISVFFEEQNIDITMVSSEMLTAVIAACAQAESESISKNMRWSYQKRMESGAFITCKAPFGYRLVNRQLVIEECEAEIVRLIFRLFLSGWNIMEIADEMTRLGIPQREAHNGWGFTTIRWIDDKYAKTLYLRACHSVHAGAMGDVALLGRPQTKEQCLYSGPTFDGASVPLQLAVWSFDNMTSIVFDALGVSSPVSNEDFSALLETYFSNSAEEMKEILMHD